MEESATKAEKLRGKRVAFTGRLACMTRTEATKLVKTHGGTFTPTVNERTSVLVVGQEGWPLQKDGRLTAKLQKAQKLQRIGYAIHIVQEQEFLCRLGLDSTEGIRRLYTTSQLTKLLSLSRDRLRSWIRADLIHPEETVDGLDYFDYGQVVSAKTLAELTQAGIKPDAIRRSLEQLRRWMPNMDQPLAQLAVLERNGELVMRVEDALVEPSGQRLLDFEEGLESYRFSVGQNPTSAEEWFELACEHEDAGRLPQAVEAYRQALLAGGPDRDACFNLANVLYAMDQKLQAVERYYQALELDRTFAEAWVNLGVVLRELKRRSDAQTAFETALKVDPKHADAHYNLADLLDEIGRHAEARPHWQAYARQDPQSEWGRYARQRLAANGL
jgi:tetratricopeptide (TPR) repeat protein